LSYQRRESLLFPVPADQFPVPTKNIPCSKVQGIHVHDIEINTGLDIENRQTGQKAVNSLLFSLFSVRHRGFAGPAGHESGSGEPSNGI
jgi:hypothetical protein